MPVCPVAYIDGEAHTCDTKPDEWAVALKGVVGAIIGAVCGMGASVILIHLPLEA
jgi:hypothetical protein